MNRLITRKAPDQLKTPWLSGSATRWQLIEPYHFEGITVPAGYVFNGSSVPRLLWWLYPPSYAPAWEASCVHDYCYSHHYPHITKKEADRLLRRMMKAAGASWVSRQLFYRAVRLNVRGGGWPHSKTSA